MKTTSTDGRSWCLAHRTLFSKLPCGSPVMRVFYVLIQHFLTHSCSEGGFFKAILTFPKEYPHLPPKMQFITEIYHPNGSFSAITLSLPSICVDATHFSIAMIPNSSGSFHALIPSVFKSGEICISILHPPGEDRYGHEDAGERWLPIHTVTTIALSVISMLSDPNDRSPANIDAAVRFVLLILRSHEVREIGEKIPNFSRRKCNAVCVGARNACKCSSPSSLSSHILLNDVRCRKRLSKYIIVDFQ